jgi:hypothetical protein
MIARTAAAPLALTALLLLAPLTACTEVAGNDTVTPTMELTTSSTERTVGEEVVFFYQASGNLLDLLTVDFGDDEVTELILSGAQQAQGQIEHTFEQPGTYEVVASLLDGVTGPISRQIVITVTAAGGGAP